MKISVAGIYERGIPDKERVHFRADFDLNLSFYVVLDTIDAGAGSVTAGNLGAFWFAPKPIARGEHFVLYTKGGTPTTERRDDGSIYHFLFRGRGGALYGNPGARVVIVEAAGWQATQANTIPLPPLVASPLSSALAAGAYSSPLLGDLGSLSALSDLGTGSALGDLPEHWREQSKVGPTLADLMNPKKR